ncbi:putative glutamate synthase [NADPH] [Smittium culicis]|uniref:glutamate synthase (NADH) n=1 Tax=Smittium culicis TaxID=133412 RepID=A0A1R1XYQ2_9FUNG|nr:putative glutamate synthase [NADPH] [Smittium culicis]
MSWAGSLPEKHGLYCSDYEKDSCGVGFVIKIDGKKSNQILKYATALLENMEHRGAVGNDPLDGDGAGIMTSIPDKFLSKAFQEALTENYEGYKSAISEHQRDVCDGTDSDLYELAVKSNFFATGNMFMSKGSEKNGLLKIEFEKTANELGIKTLGWRTVPTDSRYIGGMTKSKEPHIMQPLLILESALSELDEDARNLNYLDEFERKLFLLRKCATRRISGHPDLDPEKFFYICSLSCKKLVYKALTIPKNLNKYFSDLSDDLYETHFALAHSRFSTNTFPSWDRAQPLRMCAHNGEINSLRGNKNRMFSRESMMESKYFTKEQVQMLLPIIEESGSDSMAFDNVLELLVLAGTLTISEAMMVMVPEAWNSIKVEASDDLAIKKRYFYEWASSVMEPWDGPALLSFTDGRYCGALLDRNGLRPCRYYITDENIMVCGSEVGGLEIPSESVKYKGRLSPGKVLLVDTLKGVVINDSELKYSASTMKPFKAWIDSSVVDLDDICNRGYEFVQEINKNDPKFNGGGKIKSINDPRLAAFGYTIEEINTIILPMVNDGKEALGSMGNDTILACLDSEPRLPFDYMRQLFAQVTNPPIDPIRESIVMSLECMIGPEHNFLSVDERQVKRIRLKTFLLDESQFYTLCNLDNVLMRVNTKIADVKLGSGNCGNEWKTGYIDITFDKIKGIKEYRERMWRICDEAISFAENGVRILVLSDKSVNKDRVPLFSLLSCGAIHHALIMKKLRLKVALVLETGEVRDVHQFCAIIGYGIDAIYPYAVYDLIQALKKNNILDKESDEKLMRKKYKKSIENGVLKVMSKMGISTLHSYKGAQIFEALGVSQEVVDMCLANTATRIGGATFEIFACDAISMHENGYKMHKINGKSSEISDMGQFSKGGREGDYHWSNGGARHTNTPASIAHLQNAVREKNQKSWDSYTVEQWEKNTKKTTLRGLFEIKEGKFSEKIDIDLVEPWTEIARRFCSGAMSYGSISIEAHTTIAAAMNRLGGKSNSGEGGEDSHRYNRLDNNDSHRSAIKQIASGRFGVTSHYLCNADELQIKMAQGAKPGEGGELPGHKVSKEIAKTRKSTAGVGLISPPPHHDIYSIEDLKQLIYDLRGANPKSVISVKLVSTFGVGVIAAGVAKAEANHILISGHDGGTGASRWTGIKNAGIPWEIGLAETHQILALNNLREKVVIQTDGQIKTGKEVVIAALLGADEFGFATTPLIALGCTMMRKCHLNTCPVGIATQDPVLREKFRGKPEHVINFFYYLAEDVRKIMASLGIKRFEDLIGRRELLKIDEQQKNSSVKSKNIDLSTLLCEVQYEKRSRSSRDRYDLVRDRLEVGLFGSIENQIEKGDTINLETRINNTDRSFGSVISYFVSQYHGENGLGEDTIKVKINGSAGQSFGAFLAKGVTLELEGDCNDYVGKGLSGGKIVVYAPKNSNYDASESIIVGNVCLYGATGGEAYFGGIAAERFAVRNSGVTAVVDGVGDHGCEYMTGGTVVILGKTGRNFAAGMSGGIAYVYTQDIETFSKNCNHDMVSLQVPSQADLEVVYKLVVAHKRYTGSQKADRIIRNWGERSKFFIKVISPEYEMVLKEREKIGSKREVPTEASKRVSPKEKAGSVLVDVEDSVPNILVNSAASKKKFKLRGFIEQKRQNEVYREPRVRIKDWNEINSRLSKSKLVVQAARCMDCGIPFCQSDYSGCPIGNKIPKWNELVYNDQWRAAFESLMSTNNFPEFTGRVCPAPCEGACVLGINSTPVGIKSIEAAIIDYAWKQGWMEPRVPAVRTGKKVAIVGSGPAGLAAADQLNQAGHNVLVYEREDRAGGLLTYGIPNMKLDKKLVQRRVDKMESEGVSFIVGCEVGKDVSVLSLIADFDAVLLSMGSTWPRDIRIEGRELEGIHFAVDFLSKNTKSLLNSNFDDELYISAKGKDVIVIGGGDTGTDCIATSIRHLAKSVVNFELLPKPQSERSGDNPWPLYPRTFKVDYGHSEASFVYGSDPRVYCISSKRFIGDSDNQVEGIETVKVEWSKDENGSWKLKEVENSAKTFKADIVLLAMGFLGPEKGILEELGVELTPQGNIKTFGDSYKTNVEKVYAAGDCRRGQSLIVWGINEGRQAAREIDEYLLGLGARFAGVLEAETIINSSLPMCGGVLKRSVELNEI